MHRFTFVLVLAVMSLGSAPAADARLRSLKKKASDVRAVEGSATKVTPDAPLDLLRRREWELIPIE